MSDSPKTCTVKRHVMVDAHITVTPPPYVGRYARTPEEMMSALQAWAEEFGAFLRDHRSQDANIFDVEADYKDLCSACKREFLAYVWTEDGKDHCSDCGALVEEEVARVQ